MKTIEKINQDWAPVIWAENSAGEGYRTLTGIVENIVLSAQINDDEPDLYAFRINGTKENIINFILKRKG